MVSIQSTQREVVFDAGRNPRARLGFVLLAMEQTIEDDMFTLRPAGVGIHFSRIRMANTVTRKDLLATKDELAKAAALILPERSFDVITYACTSGSFIIGEEVCCAELKKGAPHCKAFTTLTTGVIAAFHALGVKKIVMGTPYLDEVNAVEYEYFSSRGFTILDIQGLQILHDADMVRVSPSYIKEFALSIDQPDADCLFLSCGALRSIDVIEELEQELGKPVVTSNQALMWDALRKAGIADPIQGYGRLLREY